jgi:hypothetical protein
MPHELDLIANRRSQIAALRAEHETAIKALDDESLELDVAERTIKRLMAKADFGHVVVAPPPSRVGYPSLASIDTTGGTTRKPPNIPTIPEMITEILKPHVANGTVTLGPAMTPKKLADAIRVRWWPSVTPTEISPIAWRMAKRGELVKDGSLYRRPDPLGEKIVPPDGDEPSEDES